MSRTHRVLAFAVTAVIVALLARRIPLPRLLTALERADYSLFFTAMIPNTLFYVLWQEAPYRVTVRDGDSAGPIHPVEGTILNPPAPWGFPVTAIGADVVLELADRRRWHCVLNDHRGRLVKRRDARFLRLE